MNILDALALINVAYLLPVPLWWLLIHSKFSFVKKMSFGYYALMGISWFLLGFVLLFNFASFSNRFSSYYTFLVGVLLAALVIIIDFKRRQNFTFEQLIGLPEFFDDKINRKLVTNGVFSYIRHPRYLEYILFSLALAFMTGLWLAYIFFFYVWLTFYSLAVVEEGELVQAFGKKYVDYANQVPRFVPKILSSRAVFFRLKK